VAGGCERQWLNLYSPQAHHTTPPRRLKRVKTLQKTTAPQAHGVSFGLGKLIAHDPAHTLYKLTLGLWHRVQHRSPRPHMLQKFVVFGPPICPHDMVEMAASGGSEGVLPQVAGHELTKTRESHRLIAIFYVYHLQQSKKP
jgi:hypothetical protein